MNTAGPTAFAKATASPPKRFGGGKDRPYVRRAHPFGWAFQEDL
jgi:hypothetical protein